MSSLASSLRIGQGFDVHSFAEGRPLYLGTVAVPHTHGLKGHSDADVLLHAVMDAVLGALGWGDIGVWFPDRDPAFKNIRSELLFRRIWDKAAAEGWKLINCDSVIMAQQPIIAPYAEKMKVAMATLFSAERGQIGIKATTTEHLGFVGRQEGIAASAVVLLERISKQCSDKREN